MPRKEEILERTSKGLDVFRHYLPVKWRVGRNFLNPLYEDSKASCNVYYDRRSGTYKMKDFGNGDFSGDCFFLVAKIKGLDCRNAADFVEVLETIDRELCLGIGGKVPPEAMQEQRMAAERNAHLKECGRAGTDEAAELPEPERRPCPYQTTQQPFTEKELAYWAEYGITEETLLSLIHI